MPWTDDNPPSVAKNWSESAIHKCVAAANSALEDGKSDADAVFACIHAAGHSKRNKEATMPVTMLSDIKELSVDDVRGAICDILNPPRDYSSPEPYQPYKWVVKLYKNDSDGRVIVEAGEKLYQYAYTIDSDDVVTLDEPVEVTIVYEPVATSDEKAKLTAKEENALSDSDFAYIDSDGKRHLPVNDAAHTRNALARFDQTHFESDAAKGKAYKKVLAAAKKFDIAVSEEKAMHGKKIKSMLSGMIDKMKSMLSMMDESKRDDDDMDTSDHADMKAGFHVFKTKAGSYRWIARSANAFKDHEGEIFSTKALEDYVERSDTRNNRGTLRLWHVKGTDIGVCDFSTVEGRFLIESGTFDDTPQAKKALDYFIAHEDTPFEMSIGYLYKAADRADSIYEWLDIPERSVCPPKAAMNPWTGFATIKEVDEKVNESKKAFLEGVFGTEFVADLVTKAEEDTKALETDVDFKEFDVKALAAELSKVMQPVVESVKTTSETFTATKAAVDQLTARLDKIEADAKAFAEKAAHSPRIAGYYANRPGAEIDTKDLSDLSPAGTQNPNHPLNRPLGRAAA